MEMRNIVLTHRMVRDLLAKRGPMDVHSVSDELRKHEPKISNNEIMGILIDLMTSGQVHVNDKYLYESEIRLI